MLSYESAVYRCRMFYFVLENREPGDGRTQRVYGNKGKRNSGKGNNGKRNNGKRNSRKGNNGKEYNAYRNLFRQLVPQMGRRRRQPEMGNGSADYQKIEWRIRGGCPVRMRRWNTPTRQEKTLFRRLIGYFLEMLVIFAGVPVAAPDKAMFPEQFIT